MTDREKIIEWLKECLSASCRGFRTCPYSDDPEWDAVEAALILLREQEPVKWIRIHPAQIYECSGCGQNVMTGDIKAYKYCHGCGRKVKWDD